MLCAHRKFYINGGCVAMNKNHGYFGLERISDHFSLKCSEILAIAQKCGLSVNRRGILGAFAAVM